MNPEEQWRRDLRKIAATYSWHAYHTHRSDRSDAGWPDEVFCKGPRVVFVELKSLTGRITTDQRKWLTLLEGAGQEVGLWRPSDVDLAVRVLGSRGEWSRLPDDFVRWDPTDPAHHVRGQKR